MRPDKVFAPGGYRGSGQQSPFGAGAAHHGGASTPGTLVFQQVRSGGDPSPILRDQARDKTDERLNLDGVAGETMMRHDEVRVSGAGREELEQKNMSGGGSLEQLSLAIVPDNGAS